MRVAGEHRRKVLLSLHQKHDGRLDDLVVNHHRPLQEDHHERGSTHESSQPPEQPELLVPRFPHTSAMLPMPRRGEAFFLALTKHVASTRPIEGLPDQKTSEQIRVAG